MSLTVQLAMDAKPKNNPGAPDPKNCNSSGMAKQNASDKVQKQPWKDFFTIDQINANPEYSHEDSNIRLIAEVDDKDNGG